MIFLESPNLDAGISLLKYGSEKSNNLLAYNMCYNKGNKQFCWHLMAWLIGFVL